MAILRTTKTIRHATPRLQYNNNSAATLDMVANLHTKKLSDTPHATRLPFTETHVVYPQREFENAVWIYALWHLIDTWLEILLLSEHSIENMLDRIVCLTITQN